MVAAGLLQFGALWDFCGLWLLRDFSSLGCHEAARRLDDTEIGVLPVPTKKRHLRRCHSIPGERNDTQKGVFDLLIEKRHQQKLFHGARTRLVISKRGL